MPQLKLWRFILRFAVLYGLLIYPWPGFQVGPYVQAFGSRAFGHSGRVMLEDIEMVKAGFPPVRHVRQAVLFRAKEPGDRNLSAATDAVARLYNFDAQPPARTGGTLGFESRQVFWLPFAFYLALLGATSLPWRRRAWGMFWGLITFHILLALTLGLNIAHYEAELSMIYLAPFWNGMVGMLVTLLMVLAGPSLLAYLFVWLFVAVRYKDMIRWVNGGNESLPTSCAAAPEHQQSGIQIRVSF